MTTAVSQTREKEGKGAKCYSVTYHLLLLQASKAYCLAEPSEDSHQNPVDLGPLSHYYIEK